MNNKIEVNKKINKKNLLEEIIKYKKKFWDKN